MNNRPNRLPRHVAIIMDGNGRWAAQRGLSRTAGHRAGAQALRKLIGDVSQMGIDVLTVYAFSTENWSRPKVEIEAIFAMIAEFFSKHINELIDRNVKVRFLGDAARLPGQTQNICLKTVAATGHLTGMQLNIALNYGGRQEIADAVRRIASLAVDGSLLPSQIDETVIAQHLDTAGQPDVDLLIRTSGEYRLSGFLLYQCAYAELVFTGTLWPDYTTMDFSAALAEYASRERRFGDISARRAT